MKKILIFSSLGLVYLLILLAVFYFYFIAPSFKKQKPDTQDSAPSDIFVPQGITSPASELPRPNEIKEVQPKTAEKLSLLSSVFIEGVPFISQATGAQWKDPRFQDACEETSAFLAVSWAQGKSEVSRQENTDLITTLAEFQLENWESYQDTSAQDTAERIFKKYFNFDNIEIKKIQNIQAIVENLHQQKIVIVPINGQAVGNPFYTQPGPERHMLLIVGYDAQSKEFVTNDIGIGKGQGYCYKEKVLFDAIRDYETGYHELFPAHTRKVMLIISKI